MYCFDGDQKKHLDSLITEKRVKKCQSDIRFLSYLLRRYTFGGFFGYVAKWAWLKSAQKLKRAPPYGFGLGTFLVIIWPVATMQHPGEYIT